MEVYSWAGRLTSESRKLDWFFYWYIWPGAVREMIHELEGMKGGMMKLFVGLTSSRSLHMVSMGCFFRRNIQNTCAILKECEIQAFEDLESH